MWCGCLAIVTEAPPASPIVTGNTAEGVVEDAAGEATPQAATVIATAASHTVSRNRATSFALVALPGARRAHFGSRRSCIQVSSRGNGPTWPGKPRRKRRPHG